MTFFDINEEGGCDGKHEDVQEKVMPAETHIKENLGNISQYWKCKGSNVGNRSRLRKEYGNSQGIEKILIPYCKLYDEKK